MILYQSYFLNRSSKRPLWGLLIFAILAGVITKLIVYQIGIEYNENIFIINKDINNLER